MMEALQGTRGKTDEYKKLNIELGYISFDTEYKWFEMYVHRFLYGDTKKLGKTYQEPDKIEEGIKLISNVKLWENLAIELNIESEKIKKQLREIVKRRNKIAHESDIDPSYPNLHLKNPINLEEIKETTNFIENLVKAIYKICC
jgi:hypothetical protein